MKVSPEVEIAMSVAQNDAARRRHEYFTIEHLLFALLLDDTTASIVRHAGGNPETIKRRLDTYLSEELESLPEETAEAPAASLGVAARHSPRGHARALERQGRRHRRQRAHRPLRRARLLRRVAPRGAGRHAARRRQLRLARRLEGRRRRARARAAGGADSDAEPARPAKDPLKAYTVNLNDEAENKRIDPLVGRENEVVRIVQILARRKKNNPLLVGDAGVGKTAIAEGLALKIQRGEVPAALYGARRLLARHGRAARRHALPRRLRGAHQGGHQGAAEDRPRHPLHRRDPHDRRRRRDHRRQHGREQPAQARAGERPAALHRVDHVPGVPPALRERPRAVAALPARGGQRAQRRRHGEDPPGSSQAVRGVPRRRVRRRGPRRSRRAQREVPARPQAARQGDRPRSTRQAPRRSCAGAAARGLELARASAARRTARPAALLRTTAPPASAPPRARRAAVHVD